MISCGQVWLSRIDGHMGLANSVALQLAQITNLSQDPNGGTIVKASDGGNMRLIDILKWFRLARLPNL